MSTGAAALQVLIDRYIAGAMPFMPFWSAFMEAYTESGLTFDEEKEYEPVYDIVYMGCPGLASGLDTSVGVLDEREVRAHLVAFRTRQTGAQSV